MISMSEKDRPQVPPQQSREPTTREQLAYQLNQFTRQYTVAKIAMEECEKIWTVILPLINKMSQEDQDVIKILQEELRKPKPKKEVKKTE